MIKLKTYSSIIFNFIISVFYFKQLFLPGKEIFFIDTKTILLTPLILVYSYFGFIIIGFFEINFTKLLTNIKIIESAQFFMFVIIMLMFILMPLTFLKYKDGYKLSLTFFITFFEPLKIKYIFKQNAKILFQKNFILFLCSLFILFFSSLLPKFNSTGDSLALYMGGFYFMALGYFDYYFFKIQLKNQ